MSDYARKLLDEIQAVWSDAPTWDDLSVIEQIHVIEVIERADEISADEIDKQIKAIQEDRADEIEDARDQGYNEGLEKGRAERLEE